MPRPTFQKSRGPNGRHLAPLTPYPDDSGLVTTTIKPSGAIVAGGGGLRAYTTKDFQDGWDIVNKKAGSSGWGMVLMEPGYIIGLGGGFNDDPALLNVGGVRDNRILFWPTKGWGGVSLTGLSAKITNPNGWTLGGVRGGPDHDLGWLIVSADNFSLWRSTGQYLNSNGASGQASTGCDFVECVVPNSWVFETDTAAVRGATVTEARPTPGPITGTNYIACYLAPTWRPETSGSHTDTLQWSGDSAYGDSTVEDSVLFSSTNHGLIAGGAATDITVRNTAVIGGQVNLKRYPASGIAAPGSKFPGKGAGLYNDPYVLNGTGAPGQMKIYDSLFIGRMTNLQNIREAGGVVSNVQITSESAKQNDPRYTLVPSLSNWTAADLDREFPFPSDARLASIWAVGAIVPEDPSNPEEPGNPETPGGVLAQDAVPSFAQAFALAASPQLAFSTAATVSAVKVAPTDAKVVHTGAAAKAIVAASTTGYYRPNYLADIDGAGSSTNPRLMPAYGTRIRTSSTVVEIALQQRPDLVGAGVSTRTPIRILINGQWTSLMPIFLGADGNIGYEGMTPSFIAPGTKFWLKLTFPTAAVRDIEIQSMLEYAGWAVPAGQSFIAPAPVEHPIVWDMDSLGGGEKHGTGNYSLSAAEGAFQHGTYSHLSSLIWYASKRAGFDSVVNSSAGSSGFNISGDTVKFITEARAEFDVNDHNPEFVVMGCGFNDVERGQSTAQLQANATIALNQVKVGSPDAIRFVIGLPSIPAAAALGGATALAPYNAALKAACLATGSWFLDPILGDLFNPAGVRVADKTNMVTGNEAKISSDKTHPSQEGARFFGSGYIADMMILALPPVSTGGPVEPPVGEDDPEVEWVTDNTVPLPKTALLVVDATPAEDIESVTFEAIVEGKAVPLPGVTRAAGNNWALTFNTTAVATGRYPINATAKHRNGKTATTSRQFDIVNDSAADNKPPVVTVLAPQAGAVLPRSGQTVFRGRATDDLYVKAAGFRFRKAGVLEEPKEAAPAVVDNGVYELTVDNATLIGYDGYTFLAGDTGGLTSETAVVPFSTAPVIDRTPPSEFTLTVTASKPNELTATWTESVDVAGQSIRYRVLYNGLQNGEPQSGRARAIAPIPAGTKPSMQIVAFDEDGNETYSNEIDDVEVLGQPVVQPVPRPVLSSSELTATSVLLTRTDSPGEIARYVLERVGLADVEMPARTLRLSRLTPSTTYLFTLYAVAADGRISDGYDFVVTTPAAEVVVPTGNVTISGTVYDSASRPAYGRIGIQRNTPGVDPSGAYVTSAVHWADVDAGRLFFEGTQTPLSLAYLDEGEDAVYTLVEDLIQNGRQDREVVRHVRFPQGVSSPMPYAAWVDTTPVGGGSWPIPAWFNEAKADAAEVRQLVQSALAAAESVEAAVRNQPADYSRYGYQETPLNDPAPLLGRRDIFNGDSITVPNADYGTPPEKVYATIVAGMLASGDNFRNDHVGGSTTADVALRLLDSASSQYQDASNPRAARPDDVVILNVGTNDAGFGGGFPSGQQMFKDGLESVACIYQSAENLHSGWTKSGTWTAIAGPFSDNRTAQQSIVAGSKISRTFTVREGKGVTAILIARADGTGANFTARIDGTVVPFALSTGVATTTIGHGFGGEGTTLHAEFTPVPITHRNAAWVVGSTHTIEIEHTGGGPLIVNSIHPWGIAPTMRLAPVLYQSDAGWALLRPEAQYRITNAVVDSVYRPYLAQLIAFFANPRIKAIRSELYDTLFSYLEPGLRVEDGVHANAAGQLRLAKAVYEGVLQPQEGLNPDDYRYLLARDAGAGDGVSAADLDELKTALGTELQDRDEEIAARLREAAFEQFKLDLAGYQMKALAMNPEALVVGAIVRNAAGAAISAAVRWPDGVTGTYTGQPSSSTPGAVDAYSITYGSPATRTYTQPLVTRSSSGVVTNRPALEIS